MAAASERFDGRPRSSKRKARNTAADARPAKRQFVYGNYPAYYGYRTPGGSSHELSAQIEADQRLTHFQSHWFEGKDCLDVGCNTGLVTLSVAQHYSVKSMVGVDIDGSLILKAYRNLQNLKETRAGLLSKVVFKQEDYVAPFLDAVQEVEEPFSANCGHTACDSETVRNLTLEIHGERRIYLADVGKLGDGSLYDSILGLSVSKWIHLHSGDRGILTFFCRVHHQLRKNGTFIFEPQPWKSYKRYRNLTPEIKQCYASIRLRPRDFPAILRSPCIGFSHVQELYFPQYLGGFKRPLFLCIK